MQIYDKRLDEIKPYENNPRNNDGAVEAVSNSIKRFGFKVPIIVDSDGVIVAGHTRYKAAKFLGLQKVPCIVANDLTDEQVKAFRLADNKVSEAAGWDFGKLEEELAGLACFDVDMSEFGFENLDDGNLDDFFSDAPPAKEKEPKKVTCPHCGEVFEV